jgi:hypothetical protein
MQSGCEWKRSASAMMMLNCFQPGNVLPSEEILWELETPGVTPAIATASLRGCG